MLLNTLIGAIVQLIAFALLPFLVYLIVKRTAKGFFRYLGLYKTNASALLLALLAALVIGGTGIAVMCGSPVLRQVATGKGAVTEQISQFTSPANRVMVILIIALIKTSLAEELLFRGFIAKRLIAWLGFGVGNLLQAVLFGAVHILLFLRLPGVTVAFLSFSFLLPGIAGYVAGYLNEKKGDGSIYPGWVLHGLTNIISYSFLVFTS